MRHKVRKHKKFNNKDKNHRDAMLRNLVGQLFIHKSIMTTQKRAKAITPIVDKLLNIAKSEDKMNAIRQAMQVLYTEEASRELFSVAAKYTDRDSGMTRIIPAKLRDGDNAMLVKIELV